MCTVLHKKHHMEWKHGQNVVFIQRRTWKCNCFICNYLRVSLSLNSATTSNRISSRHRRTLRKEDWEEEAVGGGGDEDDRLEEGGGLTSWKKGERENKGRERCELTECQRGFLVGAVSGKVSCGACKVNGEVEGYLGHFHMEPGQTPDWERDSEKGRERLLMAKPFTRPHCSEP